MIKLSVFARLHYPCIEDARVHICSKELHHSIMKSKGIKVEGDLRTAKLMLRCVGSKNCSGPT